MKGKEFIDSKWVEEGAKPEAAAKIKAGFGRWSSRVGNSGLLAKARQLYEFFLSPEVSGTKKAIVAGALLYIISPFDLFPDFIPVVGWLDDLGVAGFALSYIFSTMNKVDAKKNMGDVLEAEIEGASRAGAREQVKALSGSRQSQITSVATPKKGQ